MKKYIICLCLLSISTLSYAQYFKTYDWETKPKLHDITTEEVQESSVAILEKYIVEYTTPLLSAYPKRFETKHTIVRVLDDKGINEHNRVFIPMYNAKKIMSIKARTINAEGKITTLNKENIKEVKNVEEYGDFKIFAIEGVEKNSEIEVLYTIEKEFGMFGGEIIQNDYKIKEAQFLFITGGLNSKIKAYRTEEEFKTKAIGNTFAEVLEVKNIPAMVEEEYSTPKANKLEVAYQCFNKGQSISNAMFWTNVSRNIGNANFPEKILGKAKSDAKKIIEGYSNLSTYKKVALVDDYIKTNYTIVDNNNQDLSNLNYILENRSASKYGILKVYGQYLKALDINYQIVITANRFLKKFDPNFFTPNMLRDFLIYLPKEKKYIAPNRTEARVGEAPFNILGNYGLFIKSNLDYYFSKILQEDKDYSRIRRNMTIRFNEDFEKVTILQDQEYLGHWAETSRAVLNLSTEEGIKDYKDYLTGAGIDGKEIISYKEIHGEISQLEYNKPFKIKSSISSESLIEDAGESYIFQAGLVIGTQSELYQETERINPIEMTYPNQYDYEIIVNIPQDYTVEGLNSLNIYKSYKGKNEKELAKFESSYKLENNKIIINIQEFYKTHEFDLKRYEEFRSVINAASDFNKAAILFKPKV